MKDQSKPGHRRCILLIVDALSHDLLQSLTELGKLPNIERVITDGGKLSPCLSIFPSITPAATCSIVTGAYPRKHGIEGACWFDRNQKEFAYFGDDLQLVLQRGFHDYLVDFGDRLNFERLQVPTLFEQLHARGVDSLSVNSMWFAGPHQHDRQTPIALKLGVGELPPHVNGPRFMKLGSFVESLPEGVPRQESPTIYNRYGFTDQITIDCLLDVAAAGGLPAMTVGYFPENDDLGHKEGILQAADTALVRFDHFLGDLVSHLGGWERIGIDTDIVIVGDHSQVEFGESGANVCRLDQLLEDFEQAKVGEAWTEEQQLFLCPNMRSAAIYLRDPSDAELHHSVVDRLKTCDQIGLIAFELENGQIHVVDSEGRSLRFQAARELSADWCDDFGNHWLMEGDPECVGLIQEGPNDYQESEYPNPLERIASVFVPGSKAIWVSARTDTEFGGEGFSNHHGGSHGSLHQVDSVSGLVTSKGIDLSVLPNPLRPRVVDVNALCQGVFR